ncbi:MAG: tail fiber domain-containing protein [Rhizomicrobium sp.]
MSLAYETSASFSNTGADAPTAAWFENRILDSSTIAELDGAQFWGMWAGSDASSLGTVSDVEAAKFTPIESFSNSLTTTITKAVGVHVANASKNTFNLVGQAGILIDAISSGTNNTALLVGQSTVPTGNFAIYNASTNNNFFAGNVGIGTNSPIAVAGGTPALLQLAGSGALASEIVLSTNSTAASADIGEIDFATTGTSAAEKRSALIYSQLTSASGSAVSGNLVFDTNNAGAISQVVVMTSTARVGVGTSSPAVKLAVVGDIRVGTSGTNGCLQNFAGTALTGTCSSDAALKTVRSEVTGVLNKFSELRLVRFNWNNTAAQVFHDSTDVINTGFIAQDVAKQFPELVSLDAKGYRQLDYSTLSLYGLEAIKELKAKNDQQAEEIANLKTRLSLQDQRLSEIERRIGGRSADNNLSQIASQHVTEAR